LFFKKSIKGIALPIKKPLEPINVDKILILKTLEPISYLNLNFEDFGTD
jgi:hypothetical protein